MVCVSVDQSTVVWTVVPLCVLVTVVTMDCVLMALVGVSLALEVSIVQQSYATLSVVTRLGVTRASVNATLNSPTTVTSTHHLGTLGPTALSTASTCAWANAPQCIPRMVLVPLASATLSALVNVCLSALGPVPRLMAHYLLRLCSRMRRRRMLSCREWVWVCCRVGG